MVRVSRLRPTSSASACSGSGKVELQHLSQRRLQRTVLARQQLLERSADSIPDVLARVAGLQSQYAPTM